MGIFSQSIEKKREKEIKRDAKERLKELIIAGMDKALAKERIEVLTKVMIEACTQQENYHTSREHMKEAEILILTMLSDISGSEATKIKDQLKQLVEHCDHMYHECTIRKDDIDFASTYAYIKKTALEYDGSNRLMLQSELENLLHVVEETIDWETPDFLALAYFCLFGKREDLAEIENHQRNSMVLEFYKEQFWLDFETELDSCSEKAKLTSWIDKYIHTKENQKGED